MSETHTMEKLAFDNDGEPICKDIHKKKIELVIDGYKPEWGQNLADTLDRMGLGLNGSGIYPDGSRWYRFDPRKVEES